MYRGIDVSDNQGVINWKQVGEAGCHFTVLRSVRQSGQPDNQFVSNVKGCRAQNIPFEVYKYTLAVTPSQVLEEAGQVKKLLQDYGIKCRVWWDVEDRGTLKGLGSKRLTELIQIAQKEIEGAGLTFGIYTGQYVYQEKWFDFAAFKCPFWIARYFKGYQVMQFGNDPDEKNKPDVGRNIAGWQYTSAGRIKGIEGNVDLSIRYDAVEKKLPQEEKVRQILADIVEQWLGFNEADGTYKQIIDIYNAHTPLARGYKVKYTDSWCAATVTAAAIKAGYTDIIPAECSCDRMAALFSKAGRWIEDDAYVPDVGDILFYDWQDTGTGDNKGGLDHAGIVISVNGDSIKVIEGNKDHAVGYRTITINGKNIRGFGVPDFASKAAVPELEYYPKTAGQEISIVKALESIGEDGSYNHRKQVAAVNGITGYSGTAAQNTRMLNLLRTGQLLKTKKGG